MKNTFKILSNNYSYFLFQHGFAAENSAKLLKTDWTFKGLFGKFDRASLQRGYQVYTQVCASCHSMNI